jgi:hypothetical protein
MQNVWEREERHCDSLKTSRVAQNSGNVSNNGTTNGFRRPPIYVVKSVNTQAEDGGDVVRYPVQYNKLKLYSKAIQLHDRPDYSYCCSKRKLINKADHNFACWTHERNLTLRPAVFIAYCPFPITHLLSISHNTPTVHFT